MRSPRIVLALAIFAAAGCAGFAARADADPKILQDREALMKNQAQALGAVKGYLDGKADLAKAEKGAADLIDTMKKIPAVFPQGSGGKSPDGKFATKPDIWTDWNGFLAARDTAEKKTEALVAAVKGGNKDAIQAAFADLGKNGCGACHGKFREEVKQ